MKTYEYALHSLFSCGFIINTDNKSIENINQDKKPRTGKHGKQKWRELDNSPTQKKIYKNVVPITTGLVSLFQITWQISC